MLKVIDELEASLELLAEELYKAGVHNSETFEVINDAIDNLYYIENELIETYGVEDAALKFHTFLSHNVPENISIAATNAAAPMLAHYLTDLRNALKARITHD